MNTLRLGSTGADVAALQHRLRDAGFSPGALDGIFGPATQAAVLAFQRSEGLLADGIAGPRTIAALGLDNAPAFVSAIPAFTVEIVSKLFPDTPVANIRTHLPLVLDNLVQRELVEQTMVLVALGTIRAETESFRPISEGQSRFNTSPGAAPFDLYDHRKDLGNQGPPDGRLFRGRGFIQLTGRANYRTFGRAIGLGDRLLSDPELANDPPTAAQLLAAFLKNCERPIKQAFLEHDRLAALKIARRLVNGGSHGLDKFIDTYENGDRLLSGAAATPAIAGT